MALEKYNKKRSFETTPEPMGGSATGKTLQFVVQKHAASHLHYDFRLEVDGVLKSWAIPKGPTLDPAIKHLAMQVEDHPYDYKDFEGIIPKGNYGGGTVIVWDQGTYEPLDQATSKKEQEKIMLKSFESGSIKIRMHGKKLKGEFALVRTSGKNGNEWLIIKHKDQFATSDDITLQEQSVISGKTIEQMGKDNKAKKWISNRAIENTIDKSSINSISPNEKKRPNSLKELPQIPATQLPEIIKQGIKEPMPLQVSPMLCTLTKEPLNNPDYLYEVKWDGYRIISYTNKGTIRMDSRSAQDYTKRYPLVAAALKNLGHDAVLDGEVVVFNPEGLPDFDALQLYNGHQTPIAYCVFDLLWLDGYNLMALPLTERKQLLQNLITGQEIFRFSESFDQGPALYEQMMERNLEGIVAKRKDSPYTPGERANNWLKTPTRKRQEFVIGGWAESDKNRSFRSLLFGAYHKGKLEWIGRSGGGYKEKEMPGILTQLKALETDVSPFVNKVLDTKGAVVHWVKPQLVANFEFATWTKSGRIRKPATFLGFRKDKKALQVVREVPQDLPMDQPDKQTAEKKVSPKKSREASISKKATNLPYPIKESPATSLRSNWPEIEKQKVENEDDFQIGDCTIKISNVGRSIWTGITKADLITYYHSIASYILPYLKDRPESLHVKLKSASAPGLFIKDMEGRQPDCADIFTDKRRHKEIGKRDQIDYLVCNNESTLLYMVNLGCIDINPWNSRVQSPDQPDYIAIDLDPTQNDPKNVDLVKLIDTAMATKEYCDSLKLKVFAKTSGQTGIHFFIPCTGIHYAKCRQLAEQICAAIHQLVPEQSTISNSINSRGDKVYLDPSQNDYGDTLASCYSVRPYHIPMVSTPLEWKEINQQLNPSDFTIYTLEKRLRQKGDLFAGLFDKKFVTQNTTRLLNLFI